MFLFLKFGKKVPCTNRHERKEVQTRSITLSAVKFTTSAVYIKIYNINPLFTRTRHGDVKWALRGKNNSAKRLFIRCLLPDGFRLLIRGFK